MTTLTYHPSMKDVLKQYLSLSGFEILNETSDSFESAGLQFAFVKDIA